MGGCSSSELREVREGDLDCDSSSTNTALLVILVQKSKSLKCDCREVREGTLVRGSCREVIQGAAQSSELLPQISNAGGQCGGRDCHCVAVSSPTSRRS